MRSDTITDKYDGIKRLRCPECYQECGWCSWFMANARAGGCGVSGKRKKCKWGEDAKGKPCGTCDGSGFVNVRMEIVR